MVDPSRSFPFRRALGINPYLLPVTEKSAPVSVMTIDKAAIQASGVTSFKMTNECPFYVWFRGWNKNADGSAPTPPTIFEMGHYIPPGSVDINTSQIPDYMAAVAADTLAFPIYNTDGSFVYAGKQLRLVMLYGSGQ
jgi:P pilus assembly chaperone PapD